MLDAGAQATNMFTAMATTGGDIGPPPGMASTPTTAGEEGQESKAKRFFVGEPITPPPGCPVDELRQFMISKFEVGEQRVQHLDALAQMSHKGCEDHRIKIKAIEDGINKQNLHEGEPIKVSMDNRHAMAD